MQITTLSEALLILVFRCARSGRHPNLTAFCRRSLASTQELQQAFDELERRGLLSFTPEGERLTLEGLAVSAALSRRSQLSRRARPRPLAVCRGLAA